MSDAGAALALAVLLVCSVFAPSVGAVAAEGDAVSQQSQQAPPDDTVDYDAVNDQLQALASVGPDTDVTLSDQREAAATRGARAGATIAQQQGINVTQAQRQAAVDGAVRAAAQVQNASIEQVQAAARGAAHGALLQSQRANVTQLQAGIYGASAGALSQFQQANVTQLQSAAYGAAHGVVAQHQRANVSQLQFVAVGSAAGAARSAAQTQRAIVSQIQEAAQGSAYGSLVQRQNVTLRQRQAAAFGAAGGGAGSEADTDPKKIQEAAMGAARGTLFQGQQVSITQIQSAARGACRGALSQSQNVTVTQIQEASVGAAQGALTQSQSATVRQVQAAAHGAAGGVLVQIQVVNIVQIQQAAFGAARGAAQTAAAQQITNVEQIQAAAAGAGQGTIIQIQQINVVQIQIVADSAASGALSQYQAASVSQIQSAALGASEGALLLTQRQAVDLEQLQRRTERAAASTASIAADIDVVNEVTINVYARSAVTDPEPEPDEPERLRSLFAATDDETLFLANPNDVAATVTITRDGGAFETITLAPGESATRELDPGEYALTAETADGRTLRLAGRTQLRFAVGDALRSLSVGVDEDVLTVENTNDQRVTVTVTRNGSAVATFDVPRDWTVSQRLDPGTYRVIATAADGRRVPVNGEDNATVTVEPTVIDLTASLDGRALAVENPGDRTVTVRVDSAAGQRSFEVSAGATETVTLTPVDPVGHVVSGTAPDRTVLVNGLQSDTVFVPLPPTVDLDVGVEGRNVTIENPSDAPVTVTAAPTDGANRTIDVPAGDRVTTALEPGNYALTGQADEGRSVRLNGQSSLTVTIEDEAPPAEPRPPVDLDVTVTDQNVTIRNPGPPAVTVTATPAEADVNRTIAVPANATVTERFDPGNYTLTAESDDGRPVQFDGERRRTVRISAPAVDRTIESCRSITAPGQYEIVGDIRSSSDRSCLRVQVSNVTIDGGEYAIEGAGPVDDLGVDEANAGVLVDGVTEERIENVTVRNLSANGWNAGVQVHVSGLGGPTDVRIENVTARGNDVGLSLRGGTMNVTNVTTENNRAGIDLATAGPTTVADATVRNNDIGVGAVELASGVLRNATVRDNADGGVLTSAAVSLRVENTTVSDNGGFGVRLQGDAGSALADVTVTNNTGPGVEVLSSRGTSSIDRSVIANNGGVGVRVDANVPTTITDTVVRSNGDGITVASSASLSNVTVTENDGLAFDARTGTASATDLRFGPTTTVAFDDRSVALDPVANGSLPALPDGATAVGAGLNVTGLDDTAQVRFTFDATEANETVERWRYNGTAWASDATDPTPGDGSIEETIDRDGLYAPVRPPERLGVNVTVGNRVVWVANPSEEPLVTTLTNASGTGLRRSIEPGVKASLTGLDPGDYRLTAATEDGESVAVDNATERQFTLPPDLQSLSLTVEDRNLTVENPNDEPVTLILDNETGPPRQFAVDPAATGQFPLASVGAGNYTARAETADGRDVPVDGRWNRSIEISVTPTGTETATPTATATETPTSTATETTTPTVTAPPIETETVTASPSETETETASPTATATTTETATDTATGTASPTETATATITDTATPIATDTESPTSTATESPTTAGATETESVTTAQQDATGDETSGLLAAALEAIEGLFE